MGEYNISGESPEEIKTRIMNLNNMRECQENTLKQMEAEVNYLRGYLDGMEYVMEAQKRIETIARVREHEHE